MSRTGAATWSDLRDPRTFLVGAHRGGRDLGPENTLETAEAGFQAGASFWELDVQLTADGVPVVIHDETLKRTTDAQHHYPNRGPWRVADFLWEELALLRVLKPGSEMAESGAPRIPSLRQALEWTRARAWLVNVEIKGRPEQHERLVRETVALVRELSMLARVLLSSFHQEVLLRAKAMEPRLMTGALLERPVPDPVALVRALGADAVHPAEASIGEETVRRCRAAGVPVIAWTVNDPERAKRLKIWGVSAVITDRPHCLVTHFNAEEDPF